MTLPPPPAGIPCRLQAQFLELIKLREQVRTAQLSADLEDVARASEPAPVVIAAAA
jgi:hypothetical protein